MFTVFNIIVIGFILLVAYWWGNQGLFSSILHFISVVAAAAIAFAIWEPITMPLLGGGFAVYAWGTTLIVSFTLLLLAIRKAFDKVAPGNVALPHWADLTFGSIIGLGSGTVTMGVLLIGMGHIQSHRAIMGYVGTARSTQSGKVIEHSGLWIPAHTITADLFSYMSTTSMLTAHPMAYYAPELDRQSTLIRDSFGNGKGAIAMSPEGATIRSAVVTPDGRKAYVNVAFNSKSIDFNDQLTISQSQIRLIGDNPGAMKQAPTANPVGWSQEDGSWPFESISFYMTSTSGQESAEAVFEFTIDSDFDPQYIQIKGTRFELPRLQEGDASLAASSLGGGTTEEVDPSAPGIDASFEVSSEIRPLYLGTNNLSGMKEDNLWLTEGDLTQASSGSRPGKNLRIKGIYAPAGSQIVKVRVDPRSVSNVFDKAIWNEVEPGSSFRLVDSEGRTYSAIGYFHKRADNRYRIFLQPGSKLTSDDIPFIPGSGDEELRLIFRVSIDETIVGLKLGDITVGTASQTIEAESTVGR